jgi:hypothetical protein
MPAGASRLALESPICRAGLIFKNRTAEAAIAAGVVAFCIIRAAVTNAALDSEAGSGAEYGVRENFQPKISTQRKKLC